MDLFSGAGGMTQGFSTAQAGRFEPGWAVDNDPSAVATYNANFGDHCLLGDVAQLLRRPAGEFPEADVVIGGPPCQGFSLLNRNRNGDDRRSMWRPFLEFVQRCNADVFVMENVPGILKSPELVEIESEAEQLGFQVHSFKVCAADYGVPQLRWRAFIVGCRVVDPAMFFPPLRTHFDPLKFAGPCAAGRHVDYVECPQRWRTVRDAIEDLPAPEGTTIRANDPPFDLHVGRRVTELSMRRYEAIPEEGMNRFDLAERAPELNLPCWTKRTDRGGTDLFGRLWWDQPASTIRTEFWKPEKGRYLHPEQHRALTLREGARLQAFPDHFTFVGSKLEIGRQIGNAVPSPLAARIADAVATMLGAGEGSTACPTHSLRSNAAD